MNSQNIKITIFYCTNSVEPEDIAGSQLLLDKVTLTPIGLPCSGKVDVPYLMKAFETGADGAVIVTCKQNECRHLEGNLRANRRAEAVNTLLDEIGAGGGRMAVVMLKDGGVPQALDEIKGLIDRIRKLPHLQKNAVPA